LDPNEFVIGYLDRFTGIKEIEFKDFRTKDGIAAVTFIPFHRVVYFKRKGEIVWDKQKRLDLL